MPQAGRIISAGLGVRFDLVDLVKRGGFRIGGRLPGLWSGGLIAEQGRINGSGNAGSSGSSLSGLLLMSLDLVKLGLALTLPARRRDPMNTSTMARCKRRSALIANGGLLTK